MGLAPQSLFKSAPLTSDLSNLPDFLSAISEVISQGFTNRKLQLETPINILS